MSAGYPCRRKCQERAGNGQMKGTYVEPQVTSYLFAKAAREHTPINGTFELSPLCNFNCRMCYVHMTAQQVRESGLIMMSNDEWLKLAEEATELADAAFRLYKNMDASGITVRENIHHVLEEIVDVEIVGKQMRLHYLTDYPDCEVVKIRNSKLNRTVERMSAGAFDGV